MIEINLFFDDVDNNLSIKKIDFSILKNFISFMTKAKSKVNLTYILVTKNKIKEINKEYLNHNYSTDIITFDLSNTKDNCIVGEIYICLDEIIENSIEYKVSEIEEINRVIVHGFLHLIGYNDRTKEEKKLMKYAEDLFLSLVK